MDKYDLTATEFRDLLGGASNITTLTHCITRLRMTLADRSRVVDAGLRAHPAVLGLLERDTFQVLVGPAAVAPLAEALTRAIATAGPDELN